MFFKKWVIMYHFPVKLLAGLAYFSSVVIALLGAPDTQSIGISVIVVSSVAWLYMDILTDWIRSTGVDIGDTVKKIQSLGGTWAVVTAIVAVGIRIFKTGFGFAAIICGAILIALMIFQVLHEFHRSKSAEKDSKEVDWIGSSASYVQQLIPIILWMLLSLSY